MSTRGGTITGMMVRRSLRRDCFVRRVVDGVAAFFRFLKKSPRFGIGISAPFMVLCFFIIFCPYMSGQTSSKFTGALLKVERADKHIDDLKGLFDAFCKTHRTRFIIGKDTDGTQFVELDIGDPIPPEIPLIIGDAIHNLRSALDHATWELFGIDGCARDRDTAFPVRRTKAEYEATCNGIKTPHSDTIKFFIALEAYEGGRGERIFALHHAEIQDSISSSLQS